MMPSPLKSHSQVSTSLEERSVNCTVTGTTPVVGEASNWASGCGAKGTIRLSGFVEQPTKSPDINITKISIARVLLICNRTYDCNLRLVRVNGDLS